MIAHHPHLQPNRHRSIRCRPGSLQYLLKRFTAKVISGRVTWHKNCELPIASLYGTFLISSISSGVVGDISFDIFFPISIGVETALQSIIPNFSSISFTCFSWSNLMLSFSMVTLMPKIFETTPKYFILKRLLNWSTSHFSSASLLVTMIKSSTHINTMIVLPFETEKYRHWSAQHLDSPIFKRKEFKVSFQFLPDCLSP